MDTKRINKPKAVAIGLFHVVAGAAMIWWAVGSNPFSGPPAYARHYEEGRRLMAEGRPEAALARFEITIRDKGDFAEGHYARALALYQLGQFMEAREGFEAALRREPNMYLALRNLAAVQLELGTPDDALQTVERARALRDDDLQLHHNRGMALSGLGRFAEAASAFDRALELGNPSAETRYRRGLALVNVGRWADALPDFEAAVGQEPRNADYLFFTALALGNVDRPADALSYLDRAIAERPSHVEQHFFRATALYGIGRAADALEDVERVLALDPENEAAAELRARLLTGGEGNPPLR